MSKMKLDCTGMACPQPVLQTKNALETSQPGAVSIVVDNEPARENVIRFLQSQGYAVDAVHEGNTWVITGSRSSEDAAAAAQASAQSASAPGAAGKERVAVFLTTETMGRGDDRLGAGLMGNFLATLPELGDSLWRIVMVNGAVKMACAGHDHLEKLQKLENDGVSLLVCGTCLSHFSLLESKRVGETTNMLDVVTSLQNATRVIQL